MMDADYQPSKETTNFARISRLVLDVIPDLLRDLLITQLSGSELSAVLADQKSKICSGLPPQIKKILYPGGGVYQGSVKDLDISLLYSLHRNLGNIPATDLKCWGDKPDIVDRSLWANIERLREQRNVVFAHARNTSLSDGDFQASWDIIRQSVEEIQNSELNTDRFVVAVDAMYALEMDHRMTNKYIEELLLDMKADMSTMREDVGVLRETVDTMATDSRQVRGAKHYNKASNEDIPEAIAIHNKMVNHLDGYIYGDDLIKLKELFKEIPLTPAVLENIHKIHDLFKHLIDNEIIRIGSYTKLISNLRQINRKLATYVEDRERDIQEIIN